ncbi:class I SAM-dependent methyltransferase [Enterococcus rivorum]
MVRWSISLLPQQKPKNILDIGIGNGLSTTFLADTFRNAKVHGIDLSAEAIKASQNRKNSFDHSISFSQQSINQTTFSTREFHLITAFQTHFHWENIGECFEEIHRILDDNGTLLISCEFAKLAYFLKQFSNKNYFEAFLEERGFLLHSVEKKNGWISYTIYKKT